MQRELFAGVMSGTSLDGADAVVADFAPQGSPKLLGAAHEPMPASLRAELMALQGQGVDEIGRAARASVELADLYARAIASALRAASVDARDVVAAGVHGQTVRHRPEEGYTVQLNDPARVAERCGLTVVADFRRRDIAAGGQGAPLVPAFHAALFSDAKRARAVLNLGGIANLTLLVPDAPVRGFDTGPGNVLLDAWHERHRGAPLDAGGAWAATGRIVDALLARLLSEPYFARRAPKSTGRDLFNPAWLDAMLAAHGGLAPRDVQATLVELTACTVADAIGREAPGTVDVLACGGGARNAALLGALARRLGKPVATTAAHGVDVEHVEALAFAWLAREALAGRPGNLTSVTGARGARVLGAIYPR
jgi:anhydro-N-acetylmuramic acid kinase